MDAINDLEDGELTNDSDNASNINDGEDDGYTPLTRPLDYAAVQPKPRFPPANLKYSSSSASSDSDGGGGGHAEDATDSDCDSDDSIRRKLTRCPGKKTKLSGDQLQQQKKEKKKKHKILPKVLADKGRPPAKYNVWNTRAQEDLLSETLIGCDVTLREGGGGGGGGGGGSTRTVESYDYENYVRVRSSLTNKRTVADRRNANLQHVGWHKAAGNSGAEEVRGEPRDILGLNEWPKETAPPEDVAKDIANKLCEQKEELISRVVNIIGIERAIKIFNETKDIEKEGGMLIMNQTRRRTPGGVFLYLLRNDSVVTKDEKDAIFMEDREQRKEFVRSKRRERNDVLKQQVAQSRNRLLPDLLTRAELLAVGGAQSSGNFRLVKEGKDGGDVINPPPTPETDTFDNNSGDGTTDSCNPRSTEQFKEGQEDLLELHAPADMDLF